MTQIYLATEDALSEAVADRLVLAAGHGFSVAVRMGRKGNTYLKDKFFELCKLASSIPVLLITDLDSMECPPALIDHWCGDRKLPQGMIFRVAVREVEAWLLADREGFAAFTGIPKEKIPLSPEQLDDPKKSLLDLVRRYGRRQIKTDLLPNAGSNAKIGFGYNAVLSDFVVSAWSLRRAMVRADSLGRTCRRLAELASRLSHH